MAVGTADYSIKNLNEKTNAEIEGFLKKSRKSCSTCASSTPPVSSRTPPVSRLSRRHRPHVHRASRA